MDDPMANRDAEGSPSPVSGYLCDEFVVSGPLEELERTYNRRRKRDNSLGEESEALARAYRLALTALTNVIGVPPASDGEAPRC